MMDLLVRILCGTMLVILVAGAAIIWTADIAPWLARKGWLP